MDIDLQEAYLTDDQNDLTKWQVERSFIIPATAVSAPVRFTPPNLNLIASDTTWKQAPAKPGEGWQSIDYDDSAWSDLSDFNFEGSVAPDGSEIARVRYRSYSPVKKTRYFRLITN